MLRIVAVAALVAVGATAVYAQNLDAIKARQTALKAMAASTKAPGGMMKGAAPFNLATVQASLKTIQENAPKAKANFPENSKTGGDTEALPLIWQKKSDVDGRFDKLVADAKAAAAAIKDEASFKANWPKVVSNCGGCHKVYRKPKT